MVITRESGGTELEQFLSGKKGLLVAAGDAEAGVNLADLGQDDVRVSGQTVTIRLPDPEILSVSLDEDDAPVYDRHFGLLNIRTDDDLVEEARDVAVNRIEEAARDENILNQAEQTPTTTSAPLSPLWDSKRSGSRSGGDQSKRSRGRSGAVQFLLGEASALYHVI
jgi:hypothetical protein